MLSGGVNSSLAATLLKTCLWAALAWLGGRSGCCWLCVHWSWDGEAGLLRASAWNLRGTHLPDLLSYSLYFRYLPLAGSLHLTLAPSGLVDTTHAVHY